MLELLFIPAAFLVLGLAVGRWWFMVAPVLFWTALAIFLVRNDGWYGGGWGEFGVALNVLVAILTVLTACAASPLDR